MPARGAWRGIEPRHRWAAPRVDALIRMRLLKFDPGGGGQQELEGGRGPPLSPDVTRNGGCTAASPQRKHLAKQGGLAASDPGIDQQQFPAFLARNSERDRVDLGSRLNVVGEFVERYRSDS